VCTPGLCKYVVEVRRHDWLSDGRYYFIDMELCDLTLEDRIREMGRDSVPEETTRVHTNLPLDRSVPEQNLDVQLRQVEISGARTTQQAAIDQDQDLDFGSEEGSSIPTPLESSPDASPDEFGWEAVMEILEDITSGLIYIHGKNIVHRDLKPRNGINLQSKDFVNLDAVLFSSRDKCWKLADFGSASIASSKSLVTTTLGRGTDGYRAPEVITRGQYNKRSDIFALGCISYEIVTGQKLFSSDWAVQEYVRKGVTLYPTRWPPCNPGTRLLHLGELTSTLLAADPMARFGAKATGRRLQLIRDGNEEIDESSLTNDDFDDCELGGGPRTTEIVSSPVLQPSLRVGGLGTKRASLNEAGGSNKNGSSWARVFSPSVTRSSAHVAHGLPNQGIQLTATRLVYLKVLRSFGIADVRTVETYYGHVHSPADAILLIEACRLNVLPRVQRRLSEKECASIRPGSVFVWDEREVDMQPWRDGKFWSQSRVWGSFLTYDEMEPKRSAGRRAYESPCRNADDDSSDEYHYKPDGLMKQSFSIVTSARQKFHLVSYYHYSQRGSRGLMQPTEDPYFENIHPPNGLYPDTTVLPCEPFGVAGVIARGVLWGRTSVGSIAIPE